MDPPPPPPHSSSSSSTSFPILAISILGILATAILLLSYYLFIIKCCLHFRLRRSRSPFLIPTLRHRRRVATDTPVRAAEPRAGLGDSAIRSIPTLRHHTLTTTRPVECSVCLAEFEERELLRVLPGCAHSFHIDCIDTWLQSSPHCPLCRLDISRVPIHTYPSIIQPVVIDVAASSPPKPRRFWQAASMGDECVDIGGGREKDESFAGVQPMRRSFSMDSSNDRALFLSVQEIRRGEGRIGGNAGGRIRRSFFSFGRSSRSATAAVLPVRSEL